VNIVKAYEGVVVKIHRFLTSILDGMNGQLHAAWLQWKEFSVPTVQDARRTYGCFGE